MSKLKKFITEKSLSNLEKKVQAMYNGDEKELDYLNREDELLNVIKAICEERGRY